MHAIHSHSGTVYASSGIDDDRDCRAPVLDDKQRRKGSGIIAMTNRRQRVASVTNVEVSGKANAAAEKRKTAM